MVFELPFALFLQARNRPVGQSQLANQSARYIGYKPQLEKLPGTLHVPQATQCTLTEGLVFLFFSCFFFSVSVKVLPVTPLVSGVFVHRAFCAYFLRIERVVELRRFLWWTQ